MSTSLASRSPAHLEKQGQGALNVFDDNFFMHYGVVATERSLSLPANMPQDDWLVVAAGLFALQDRLPFHLVDVLRYGEETYGISFAQAVSMTGASEVAIGKLMSLERVSPKLRTEKLSVDHHMAVASLNHAAQAATLEIAENQNASVKATQLMAETYRTATEALRPKASEVPSPLVRLVMDYSSLLAAVTKHLTHTEQARFAVELEKHVRTYGTGELYMDAAVPTRSIYADDASNALVPVGHVFDDEAPMPLEDRILGFIELTGGATNPALYKQFCPRDSERTIRGIMARLVDNGVLVDTGERGETTSPVKPVVWGLASKTQPAAMDTVIEGKFRHD